MERRFNLSQLLLLATDKHIQTWLGKANMAELSQVIFHYISEDAWQLIHRNLSGRVSKLLSADVQKAGSLVDKYTELLECIMKDDRGPENRNIILLTDIVGSSEKMRLFGDSDYYERILHTHNEVLVQSFQSYGGRVIKEIGDAFLVTYVTARNAVVSCIEIQMKLRDINQQREDDSCILLPARLRFANHARISYILSPTERCSVCLHTFVKPLFFEIAEEEKSNPFSSSSDLSV